MIKNFTDLRERTAIVTGAGGGVGRGLALALASAGANVVVAARRAMTGDHVAAEINAAGGSAICVQADVSRRADVEAVAEHAVAAFGSLDIVVHNAVSGRATERLPVEEIDEELFDDNAAVAIRGGLYCAQAALPHLRKGRGRYIAILAHGGVRGHGALSTYGIVKGMQRGFFKALAWELGPLGITANAIVPVAMTEGMEAYYAVNPTSRAEQASRAVLGFIGEPERDVGGAVVFLASDAAHYITGQTVFVDGGSYFM